MITDTEGTENFRIEDEEDALLDEEDAELGPDEREDGEDEEGEEFEVDVVLEDDWPLEEEVYPELDD